MFTPDETILQRNKDIARAYEEDGLTLDQCAEKFSVKVGSVRHALKINGVKSRARGYRSDACQPPGRSRPAPKPRTCPLQRQPAPAPAPARKQETKDAILDAAARACAALGGMAMIDKHYAVIDTRLYRTEER